MRTPAGAPVGPRGLARAGAVTLAVLLAWVAGAHGDDAAARTMLLRYAGSYDSAALLQEPAVRAELARLLGGERGHLERNLNVSGSVDVIGGVLAISGNAPHRGTEEEAVVCVVPPGLTVEAAILSQGVVTVFTRAPEYAQVTLCVKDWITLASSGHVDRLKQPGNVRLARPRRPGTRPGEPGEQSHGRAGPVRRRDDRAGGARGASPSVSGRHRGRRRWPGPFVPAAGPSRHSVSRP